ncbi:albusnodin family lasso peptide [Nocardioides sp. NPDC000445]|uniref:albusnodin family lasso peptide n=1 Tax=Nocardioides sp. NPDC000445 TaxID=3154257 RepID=UPI00331772BD
MELPRPNRCGKGTVYINQSKETDMFENDRTQPVERRTDSDHVKVIELGDAAELTLGSGGSGSEDKRRQYN